MSTPEKKPETRNIFAPAPEPKSKLGYYRLLSPSCGVRVSPICLGAMNFGTAWKDFMGDMTKETTFQILDYFYEQGGNFIDTANGYQNEESETWIGEWFEKTGRRDEFVVATKYSMGYKSGTKPGAIQVNYTGNSKKSMHMSVEASLKKLKTDYIDLFYVHWWDHATPVEEVMQGLNALVTSGKVLYLGVSDTPAWIVSRANQYARDHGLAQFVVYQGKWSIATRDLERDVIPMCKAEGMGLAPWNVLGGGMFKTDEELAKLKETGEKGRTPRDPQAFDKTRSIVKALQKLAEKKHSTVTGIALAYVYAKTPYVFPILGARKVEQIKGNIEALENVSLTPEEVKELEDASPLDLGFPHDMIGLSSAACGPLTRAAKYDWVEGPHPIQYKKH
eukprot:Phypoly_transcript_10639.p1 GENE.Phypoly_transcript_10639~~Phypoly_transcript_10639.p1  ORF type:complete len:417 (+),score=85.80 Phypoly_transcript_10639:80-1252(+)